MSEIPFQVSTDGHIDARSEARARPRWLMLAHAVWVVFAACAVVIFLAGIPLGYARLFSGAGFHFVLDAPAWYIVSMSVAQGVVSLAAAVVSLGLAGLVFWKKRDDPGALLVSFYLVAYGTILAGPLEALNGFPPMIPGAPIPGGMLVPMDVVLALQSAILVPTLFLLYLFPNGRFVPAWARYAAILALVTAPLFIYVTTFEWLPTTSLLALFTFAVFLTLLGLGVYTQIYRYRRVASSDERQQTKWVVFGLGLTIFITLLSQVPYTFLAQLPADAALPWWMPLMSLNWWICMSILPLSLAIAVLGYRLWDIDFLINRTLVYGALTALIIGIYVLVVALSGAVFHAAEGSSNFIISLLATAIIAVLFQPLRERLQHAVNRLMYGERDDPYRVLTRLGAQLENAMGPSAALAQTVETVADALKLPYVAIALEQDGALQTVAAHGMATKTTSRFPLMYAGEAVGELVAAPRSRNEALSPADERLLRDLARQISLSARAVALTTDLEHARLRIVTERGEARRQLGSDLHDGVGHQLVALTRQIESVMPKPQDSSAPVSRQFLSDMKQQLVATTTQVRNLSHQLYPPELQVLGLNGALRERVHAYSTFRILVDAPETMPPLPAEVEVAAYYIALEALTNVDKHARAKVCHVRLELSPANSSLGLRRLDLEIVDDGRGFAAEAGHGLGLLSMRARALEVGGTCEILPNPGGGTGVRVQIPCMLKTI